VTTVTTSKGIGLRSERGPVLGAIMLCTGLVALDSTIIATAVPSVVRDLGGFSQFPWLFSIYLLTQAVTVPLYGKFADIFGRKPVMFFGIAVFLLGSVLCGVAWSMPALIVFRALQGIGAGAVQPMSITMVGDLYSVEERARVQGYVASVWGISAVIGPTLGGLFSEYVSWRWIFFINLPLGAIAAWTLARRFNERVTRSSHHIDYIGAALLTAGSSLLILGLLEGGVAWGWGSVPSLAIFGAGLVMVIAFLLVERRAAEPILPLWVFRHRTLTGGIMAALKQRMFQCRTASIALQ
jgi:multidrug resistance protein